DGTDAVNLSPTAGNLNTLQGSVTINGPDTTTVTCNDQSNSAAESYTITYTTVARSGSALISYAGVGILVLNGSSGGNSFIVHSTASGTSTTLKGGGGSNTLMGSDAVNTWTISGRNSGTVGGLELLPVVTFSSIQNLIGGADTDTFAFADGQGVDGIIDGGG